MPRGRGLPYDGGSKPCSEATGPLARGELLPACPEGMGGLPTPRVPCQILGGGGADVLDGRARVMNRDGEDVTDAFVRGAEAVAALCLEHGIAEAILKDGSPSCGCREIHDGSFSGKKIPGEGVTCAALRRAGVAVRAGDGDE